MQYNTVNHKSLEKSCRLAISFVLRSIQPSGRFHYEYIDGKETEKYNIVRHAGALWSTIVCSKVLGRFEHFDIMERGLRYLFSSSFVSNNRAICLEGNMSKTGANALTGLACFAFGSVPEGLRYATAVRDCQGADGFIPSVILPRQSSASSVRRYVRRYYLGQVLLLFCEAYESCGDEKWLKAAEKLATFMVQPSIFPSDIDQWLCLSLARLDELKSNRDWSSFSKIMAEMFIKRCVDGKEKLGVCAVGATQEALSANYKLSKKYGIEDCSHLELMLELASRQIQSQMTEENNMQLQDYFSGAFIDKRKNLFCRIDCVQHNMYGLLLLSRLLREIGSHSEESQN